MSTRPNLCLVVLTAIVLIMASGCSEDEGNDDSSNNPSGPQNTPPVIQSVTATPADVGRGEETELTCIATDSDGDSLEYFWSAASGQLFDYGHQARWTAPNIDGSYIVHVTASDGKSTSADSVMIDVTAANAPPARPYDPAPTDGQYVEPPSVLLEWKCTDPDGDEVVYDVYFGTDEPSLIQRDVPQKSFEITGLQEGVYYHWRIVARDSEGNESMSFQWMFHTQQF